MSETNNPWQRSIPDATDENPQTDNLTQTSEPGWIKLWGHIRRWGLGAHALRLATIIITVALFILVVWVMDTFYLKSPASGGIADASDLANADALAMPIATPPAPVFIVSENNPQTLSRAADLHTVLPINQERNEVIEYTVEFGDSIFSIAEKFDLQPETLLWSNRYTMGDDPHYILPGQTLNILPMDGVYHRWSAGERLTVVAEYYSVTPEDVIGWPGNELDPDQIGDYDNPKIPDGKMLMIPGGKGSYPDFRTPRISRDEPATAKHLGPGACVGSFEGITGSLSFLWPTTLRYLSGYDYSPATNHFAIDIAGNLGSPIIAADSGVVVYAGWNDYGYGEMIVIDHGYGWQTLYAHLSQVDVSCGQEVYRGDVIGLMGSTGMSTGPHLHFEMRSDEYGRVNPWDFLQ